MYMYDTIIDTVYVYILQASVARCFGGRRTAGRKRTAGKKGFKEERKRLKASPFDMIERRTDKCVLIEVGVKGIIHPKSEGDFGSLR